MRIKLDKYYQDVSGVRLKPGEQDVNDILGQYLITHGHAIRVDNPTPAQVAEQSNVLPETPAGNFIADRDDLLAEYEALFGRSAPGNIGDDTLRERVEEARADDTGQADD